MGAAICRNEGSIPVPERRILGMICCLLSMMLASVTLPASTLWADPEMRTPPFLVRSWQTKDGMPQNSVQALAQSAEGYLWVGTRGGLARFDGVRFTTYGLSDGLKSLHIVALVGDGQGGLWIGTLGGGLSRWHSGKIATLTVADGLAHNDVMALAPAAEGGVWVGTKGGLQHYGKNGFTSIGATEGLNGEIVALATNREGGLWVSKEATGLFFCQGERCAAVEGPPELPRFHGYSLVVDRAGDLWVSIGNGMVLRRHGLEWTTFDQTHGLPYSFVYCLAQGPGSEIWAGSQESGLFVLRDGYFQPVPGIDQAVRSLEAGRDGVMWAGTQTGGLSRLISPKLTEWGIGEGTYRGQVNSLVEESPEQFWITTYGGGLFRGHRNELARVEGGKELEERPFFSTGLKMSDGTLFFGGPAHLLRRPANLEGFQSLVIEQNVTALCEDEDGTLLFGTREGDLMRLAKGGSQPSGEAKFPAPISGLLRPAGKAVWVATQGAGLFRCEAGKLRRWTVADGLPTDVLLALHSGRRCDAMARHWGRGARMDSQRPFPFR